MCTGFSNLERSDATKDEDKKYAIFLADTVVVKPEGAVPDVATAATPKDWKEVAYFLKVRSFSCSNETTSLNDLFIVVANLYVYTHTHTRRRRSLKAKSKKTRAKKQTAPMQWVFASLPVQSTSISRQEKKRDVVRRRIKRSC